MCTKHLNPLSKSSVTTITLKQTIKFVFTRVSKMGQVDPLGGHEIII